MKQAYIKNGKVVSVQTPSPQVRDGHIKIKVEYSTISAGTEMTSVKATEKGIFRRAMEDPAKVLKVLNILREHGLKNAKAKVKEGIVQLIGNYIVPTIAVGGGIKLNKALNKKYNFPPITRPIQFLFGMTSLIAGVVAGNKISREMNKQMFKEDHYRKLTWKDWAVQFDNVCLVTSISNAGTQLAKMASRFIPFAHLAPGYQVGVKQADLNINA